MSNAANYINKWHEVILEGKMELLDNLLSDDATFYSPVVFKPLEGKEITKMYLSAAGLSFNMDSFKYTRELNDGNHSILEFETTIDDISVNGVDMIEWDDYGKILSFKVMIRPSRQLKSLEQKWLKLLSKFSRILYFIKQPRVAE